MNQTFQVAANKGRTLWLQNLLREFLPKLDQSSTNYQSWFDSIIEFMENRGLIQPVQQKDYLSDVRNAIKVLDPLHPALKVVDFDKETWTSINNRSSDRLAERKTKLLDRPDEIVKRATTLLKSYQWSEIAAGLAVVTGRRCTEVIKTAQFEYKTKYSVIFTGSLKRKEEQVECIFEIPTLCEAELAIEAISSLRKYLGAESEHLSKRQVSSRYGKAVASKCDRYFSDLVPTREDKDNLYTHLFRAVYATIASYWYCPAIVPEMEFRAAIQGHYQILDEKNPVLRRSIAAGRNYFDYKISDGAGNIDGRLGIKLNLPDVKVIEQFQQAYLSSRSDSLSLSGSTISTISEPKETKDKTREHTTLTAIEKTNSKPSKSESIMTQQLNPDHSSTASNQNPISIPSFFLSRLKAISTRLEISEAEAIQALFTWTEMGLLLADSLDLDELTPQAIFESVEELKQQAQKSSSVLENRSDSLMLFDRENINQICTSVKLLAEAVSTQQKINSKNSPVEANSVRTLSNPTQNNQLNNARRMTHSAESSSATISSSQNLTAQTDNQNHQQGRLDSSPKISNRGTEAVESVDRAIDAILEFNNQENRPIEDKWHIGVGSLRKLSQRGDSVIRRVLKRRHEEIDQHHVLHSLGKWHNARGKDYPSIDEVINFNA